MCPGSAVVKSTIFEKGEIGGPNTCCSKYLKVKNMLKKERGNQEGLMEQAGYGLLCHGDGTSKEPYSSSHTGDRPERSQDAPEGSETPQNPSWRFAFCTIHRGRAYWTPLS